MEGEVKKYSTTYHLYSLKGGVGRISIRRYEEKHNKDVIAQHHSTMYSTTVFPDELLDRC
jgi:hypothetical protein